MPGTWRSDLHERRRKMEEKEQYLDRFALVDDLMLSHVVP
jgi:hypothetical protein